jgi:hypothetical protein
VPEEVVLEPLEHGELGHHRVVGLGQQLAHRLAQPGPVRLAALAGHVDVQRQLAGHHREQLGPPQAGVAVLQERGDGPGGAHPVLQVAGLGPPLRDRLGLALALAPVVDDVAQHVHGPGQVVRRDRHRGVLVQTGREREPVPLEELAAEDLVPRGAVGQQVGPPGDVGPLVGDPEHRGVHRGRARPGRGEPPHAAAGQVGAGLGQRPHHQLVGVAGEDVVGVQERQVGAGGVPGAGVAGRAEALVLLLDQPEPPVPGGELLGDRDTAVRRAVVHHDHFEVPQRLLLQRLQTGLQVALDVVEGHDDAEKR